MHADSDSASTGKRLDTWKAISAFFSRDERTVKRWEATRGLPVHRIPGQGRANVYAYTHELAAWLKSADHLPDDPIHPAGAVNGVAPLPHDVAMDTAAPSSPIAPSNSSSRLVRSRRHMTFGFAAAAMLPIAVGGLLVFAARTHVPARAPPAPAVPATHQVNPQAQELYLDGMYEWNKRTAGSLRRAVDEFSRALVADPDFAEAYVGLANAYLLLREYSTMPEAEAYAKAEQAARRALALNDKLSGAHAALGFINMFWHWDARGARSEFERAIALDPGSAMTHHWYATSLLAMHDFPAALAEIERARQLDPQSDPILADRGLILFHNGQRQNAVQGLMELEASNPTFLSPHLYLANIYLVEGDDRGYLAESRTAAQLLHDDKLTQLADAAQHGFATGARRGMLEAMLAMQQRWYAQGDESAFELARTYAWLGNKGEALRYLQIACEKHESGVVSVRNYPEFVALQSDPAYQRILDQAGLQGGK